MKTVITTGLLLLSLFACNDREQDTNVLPEATQTGANTAGCLVDGKVWVATTKYLTPFSNYAEQNNGHYIISLTLKSREETYRNSISIKLSLNNLVLDKEYSLPYSDNTSENFANYQDINGDDFYASTVVPGKIKITRLDIPKNIVSGTFEFKAVNKDGNVINITDGRFDKKFD